MLLMASDEVTVTVPPQLSEVITLAGFAGGIFTAHWTVTFVGQVIAGGVLSKTVITWLQVAELPHSSVARYVLVRVNLLTQVIFDVTSPTWVIVGVLPQLSEAVTPAILTGGTRLAHCTVTFS